MKKMLKTLAIAASGFLLLAGAAAAEGQKDAKAISYSFEGPFGTFDKAQLQRGYKVYKEVCSNCHSCLVAFRNSATRADFTRAGQGFSRDLHGERWPAMTARCLTARACHPTVSSPFANPPAAGPSSEAVPPDLRSSPNSAPAGTALSISF
jgi:cytochrome c1